MQQSESIKELATALCKAQGELKHAIKESDNPFFKSKYANLPSVIDAAKEPLLRHGLSVTQLTEITPDGRLVLYTQLMHSSGEWIRGSYPVKPIKDDPQGLASAMTLDRRVAFSAIVGIAAQDDDGNEASQPEPRAKKSPFGNAAARKTFCANVVTSMENARDLTELEEIKDLNKQRFDEMRAGTEMDIISVEDLSNQYKIIKSRLKEKDFVSDSYGQDFAEIK